MPGRTFPEDWEGGGSVLTPSEPRARPFGPWDLTQHLAARFAHHAPGSGGIAARIDQLPAGDSGKFIWRRIFWKRGYFHSGCEGLAWLSHTISGSRSS